MLEGNRLRSFLIAGIVVALAAGVARGQTRPPHSSAIAVTPDGTRVWVVNTDSNSVTVLETAGDTVVAEVPVGDAPATLAIAPDGATVYVTNADSNELSVIEAATLAETARVPVGTSPYGVVVRPDGARIYVAETNQARISVLDAATLGTLAQIPTQARPKGLAVSADGSRLIVTHYLTPAPQLNGNVTIVDTATNAVVAVVPLNLLPGRPGVAEIMPEVAIRPGTTQAWIPLVQGETGNANLTLTTTVHPAFAVVDHAAQVELAGQRTNLEQVLVRPVSQPSAIDFTTGGATAFIVNMASDDLAILAAATRTQLALVDVGSAPAGVAVTPNGARAYVSNYLGRSVSVVAVANPATASVIRTVAVTAEALPPSLINGKRLFFTARGRMSADNRIACISCHPGGGHDARDWLFGSLGEGVRSTTDIRGIRDSGAVHWTANMDELQDLEFNIRNLQFGAGLVDGEPFDPFAAPNTGLSADLDDFAAFMDSMIKPPRGNPNRDAAGGLTAAARRGKILFTSAATGCASCHAGSAFSDSDRATLLRHDVGTLAPGDVAGQDGFDTPSLLYLFDSPRYLHDGSAATLLDVITIRNPADRHGVTSNLTPPQRQDLVSYLLQVDNDRDELTAGSVTGLGTLRLPVHIRDRSHTRLNSSDTLAHKRIWGLSLGIDFAPEGVAGIEVELAGAAASLPVQALDDPPADLETGRLDWAITFTTPLALPVDGPAPGSLVAFLVVTLSSGATGTMELEFDPQATSLVNDDGTERESPHLGSLVATAGVLDVGTPEVSDGTLGSVGVRLARAGPQVEVRWEPIDADGALATYTIYRGSLPALLATASYTHTCRLTGLAASPAVFADDPGSSYFLVSATVARHGEGSLGHASSGVEIPNPGPCP